MIRRFVPFAVIVTMLILAPAASAGTEGGIGSTAGQPLRANASQPRQGTIFQNKLWWVGKPNQNPPPQTVVWTFQPLNAILWAKPLLPGLWSWYDSRSYQRCVIGISTTLNGPYSKPGQLVHSYSRRGCA